MFTQIIYKEANFHIYKINEKCEVIRNDELLSEEDYIYHSTNGYDYILIEKLDGVLTMYPLDQVVYNSFYPDTQNIYEHFKCIHIDGNLRNNNLYNLELVEDIEEWRVVTYPGVPENTYEISSWGNIRNIGHFNIDIAKSINKKHINVYNLSNKIFSMHRLVAHEFLKYNEWNSDITINHIDNNGLNNNVMNLEIVTIRQNNYHAILIRSMDCKIRPNIMIRTFCELYVKYKGDIKKVKKDLKELDLIDYFNNRKISEIIRKVIFSDITDEYFKLGDYELPYKDQLTEKEIRHICELIVKHKGLVSKVLSELQLDDNNRIKDNDVKKIRYKYQWTEISDEYFSLNDFEKCYLQENEVIEICNALINHDFSTYETVEYFKNIDKDKYTKQRIRNIKMKRNHKNISDKYFIIDKNGNIIKIQNK